MTIRSFLIDILFKRIGLRLAENCKRKLNVVLQLSDTSHIRNSVFFLEKDFVHDLKGI